MNAEDFHAATVGDPGKPLSPQVVVDAIQILRAKGCREISVVLMAAQASDLAMEDGGKIRGCDVSIRYPLPNTSPSGYAVGSDGGPDRIVISIVSARASKAGPCSVEPPGFVSKTIGFGAPCPDCGYMDCHARYLRWEAERGIVRAQVDRAPRPEWVIDTATHARLTLHGAVADVWQAIPDDPTAWIWAVQDGDCYVRLHESMASAQIAAEDAMADASEATP